MALPFAYGQLLPADADTLFPPGRSGIEQDCLGQVVRRNWALPAEWDPTRWLDDKRVVLDRVARPSPASVTG